jgi:hypothetical protein
MQIAERGGIMLHKKLTGIVAMFVLALALVGCGGGKVSYTQEALTEASGIKVTAENAGSDQSATSGSAIDLKEGEVSCVSPFTEKGSFHLTITSSDGKTTVIDQDVEGKVLFTLEAAPGTYDVKTTGNGVTGWMTVFGQSAADIKEQNDKLGEALKEKEVDQSTIDEVTQDRTANASSSSSESE